jgi:pentatricopeptide repeat protein
VFEQMQQQGCTPDVVTYTALISAYERGGQWQRALQAFQQMCMQVGRASSSPGRRTPHASSCSRLRHPCARPLSGQCAPPPGL